MKKNIKQASRKRASHGYTLVEVMIIIVIMAITLQVTVGILTVIVRHQSTTIRLTEVKSEGDRVLQRVKNDIETNAVSIWRMEGGVPTQVCDGPGDIHMADNVFFETEAGVVFRYDETLGSLAYTLDGTPAVLNSGNTLVSNLQIYCSWPGQFSDRIVSISFEIRPTVTAAVELGNLIVMRYNGFATIDPP